MCAKSVNDTHFSKKIISLLNKEHVIETSSLQEYFNGRSRRSVYRDLSNIKYLSSITHAGKYITLPHIPHFDSNGLWFFRNIGFSSNDSITVAIHKVVSESEAGQSHEELKRIFRVRIHNALIGLIRSKRLTRVPLGDAERFFYFSVDPLCASKQLEKRKAITQGIAIEHTPSPLVIIQILVEIIRSGEIRIEASGVFKRMQRSGVEITIGQVDYVFARYGIGVKKTPPSR